MEFMQVCANVTFQRRVGIGTSAGMSLPDAEVYTPSLSVRVINSILSTTQTRRVSLQLSVSADK